MRNVIFFYSFILLLVSCSSSTDNTNTNANRTQPPVANSGSLQILPSLPTENIEGLMNNADYIDLIFLNYSKTISQKEKLTVQNMVRQITNVPQPDINCAMPFCKIIYYKMPNKLLEGDIHFGNGCAYFVFRDANGQPQYTNKMGNSGVGFFNDIITKFNAAQ